VTAGAGAAVVAPAAPGVVVGAVSEAGLLAAMAAIVKAFSVFQRKRRKDEAIWLTVALRRQFPHRTEKQITTLVDDELRREAEFQRKARDRMERDLPKALRISDPVERQAAVQALLDREKRYVDMREEAMAKRASAKAELHDVKEVSPDGAYWKLGDAVTHTLDCHPPGVLVEGPEALASFARPYTGKLLRIMLAGGQELAVTPNHPVLTDAGWKAANTIHEGDCLFCGGRGEGDGLTVDDHQDAPSSIAEVYQALQDAPTSFRATRSIGALDFHGDGMPESEVNVVALGRDLLRDWVEAQVDEPVPEDVFLVRDPMCAGLATVGAREQRRVGRLDSLAGVLADGDGDTPGSSLVRGHSADCQSRRFSDAAYRDSRLEQLALERLARDGKLVGQTLDGLAGLITTDYVVEVVEDDFSGHVYSLSTRGGWYAANGVIVANCMLMAERFWPWVVLDQVHPLMHTGCKCYLVSKREAVERGYMEADFVPDEKDAVATAVANMRRAGHIQEVAWPEEIEQFIEDTLTEADEGASLDGAMIAFYVEPTTAKKLALGGKDTEPPEQLHVTLKFLGDDASKIKNRAKIERVLAEFAAGEKPLVGKVAGLGEFKAPSGGKEGTVKPVFAKPDVSGLSAFHDRLIDALGKLVREDDYDSYVPHITLAYVPKSKPLGEVEKPPALPLRFEEITLAWGGEKKSWKLGAKLQEARWERRFPKGSEHAGEFMPKAATAIRRTVRAALKDLVPAKPVPLLQERGKPQGRHVWLRGRFVFVPRRKAWNRKLDHVHFHSPAQSTNIYRNGNLVQIEGQPAPPHHHDLNPPTGADIRNIPGTAEYDPGHPDKGDPGKRSARSQGRTREQEIGSLESLLRDPELPRDDRIRYSAKLAELRGDHKLAASLRARLGDKGGVHDAPDLSDEAVVALREKIVQARAPEMDEVNARVERALAEQDFNVKPILDGDSMPIVSEVLEAHGFAAGGVWQDHAKKPLSEWGTDTSVSFFHPASGARVTVWWRMGEFRVRHEVWGQGRKNWDHPPEPDDHSPRDWEEFADEVRGVAFRLAHENGASPNVGEVEHDPTVSDHGGFHNSYTGLIRLGEDSTDVLDLAALRTGTTYDRRPSPEVLQGVWASYKVGVHEAIHGAGNGIGNEYQVASHKSVEEALTEELAHIETVKLLRAHGATDVLEWYRAHPFDYRSLGTYWPHRRAIDTILNQAGIAPELREDYLRNLRWNVKPFLRIETLVDAVVAGPNPHNKDRDKTHHWVTDLLTRAEETGYGGDKFVPILRPDLRDMAGPDGVMWNGRRIRVGSIVQIETGRREKGRWKKVLVDAEVLKVGQAAQPPFLFKLDVRTSDGKHQHNVMNTQVKGVHATPESVEPPSIVLGDAQQDSAGKWAGEGARVRVLTGPRMGVEANVVSARYGSPGILLLDHGGEVGTLETTTQFTAPLENLEVVQESEPPQKITVGDLIRYDGRADGGLSEARVTGIEKWGSGDRAGFSIEAITTENSLKPDTQVTLTQERMTTVQAVPEEPPVAMPENWPSLAAVAVAADPGAVPPEARTAEERQAHGERLARVREEFANGVHAKWGERGMGTRRTNTVTPMGTWRRLAPDKIAAGDHVRFTSTGPVAPAFDSEGTKRSFFVKTVVSSAKGRAVVTDITGVEYTITSAQRPTKEHLKTGYHDLLLRLAKAKGYLASHTDPMYAIYDHQDDVHKVLTGLVTNQEGSLQSRREVAVRVQGDSFAAVLAAGRIQNGHEDGSLLPVRWKDRPGEGGYGARRWEWEQRAFSIPEGAPAADHPIYGYVATPNESLDRSIAKAFGEVKVTLKDTVRPRTTVTYSDSNYIGVPTGDAMPSPINRPQEHSVVPWQHEGFGWVRKPVVEMGDRPRPYPPFTPREEALIRQAGHTWGASDPKEMEANREAKRREVARAKGWEPWAHGDFIEAQIHGGIGLDDVARVDFPASLESVPPEWTAELDRLGIPWAHQPVDDAGAGEKGDAPGGYPKSSPESLEMPAGTTLWHTTPAYSEDAVRAEGFRASPHGESGPGIYMTDDPTFRDRMTRYEELSGRGGAERVAITAITTRPLRLLDRQTPEGEALLRKIQQDASASGEGAQPGTLTGLRAAGFDGVRYDSFGDMEVVIHDPTALAIVGGEKGDVQEPWQVPKLEFAPKPDYPKEVFDAYIARTLPQAKNDEVADAWNTLREREQEWDASMRRALSLGQITLPDAKALGYYPMGHEQESEYVKGTGWQPLPPVLYHVTTAASAVRAMGLKTRAELEMDNGVGLGAGDDATISFTADLPTAVGIERAIREAVEVLAGRVTLDEIIERAKTGSDAQRPYYNEWAESRSGPNGEEPKFLEWMRRGRKIDTSFQGALLPTLAGWREALGVEDVEGVGEPYMGAKDGVPRFASVTRPMTEEERQHAVWDVWRELAMSRENIGGGPIDPMFMSTDTAALARVDPNEIATLTVHPKPGAQGYPMSGLGEWRTATGDAVQVVGLGEKGDPPVGPPGPRAEAVQLTPEEFAAHPRTWWHGTKFGKLADSVETSGQGFHIGTYEAAREAVAAQTGDDPGPRGDPQALALGVFSRYMVEPQAQADGSYTFDYQTAPGKAWNRDYGTMRVRFEGDWIVADSTPGPAVETGTRTVQSATGPMELPAYEPFEPWLRTASRRSWLGARYNGVELLPPGKRPYTDAGVLAGPNAPSEPLEGMKMVPVWIVGEMTNTPRDPRKDGAANARMTSLLKRGQARRGWFYENDSEDAGSVSAALPSRAHVRTHEDFVREAVQSGEPVPAHVLASYPALGEKGDVPLDSLNPTDGVFADYTPAERASAPLGGALTTLDKTMAVDPETPVTIYRGAPAHQREIAPGDFVTTNLQLARDYGGGHVIEKQVPASHVLDDSSEPLGEEYIYRPPPITGRPFEATMYHGTLLRNRPSILRHGLRPDPDTNDVWLTDNEKNARSYTDRTMMGARGAVVTARVRLENPFVIDRTGANADRDLWKLLEPEGIKDGDAFWGDALRARGYDGIIHRGDEGTDVEVFGDHAGQVSVLGAEKSSGEKGGGSLGEHDHVNQGYWSEDNPLFFPEHPAVQLQDGREQAFWKATYYPRMDDFDFWLANEKGMPHHDEVRSNRDPFESRGASIDVAGYGPDWTPDKHYAEWIREVADNIASGSTPEELGYLYADEVPPHDELVQEVYDDLVGRIRQRVRGYRRDMNDAVAMASGEKGDRPYSVVPDVPPGDKGDVGPPRVYAPFDPAAIGLNEKDSAGKLYTWHGEMQRATGQHVRGNPIAPNDPRIPPVLYHATTNLPAVLDDGYLRGRGEGGLGGDDTDRIVSLTTDAQTAVQIAADLHFLGRLGREFPVMPAYSETKVPIEASDPEWMQSLDSKTLIGDERVETNQRIVEMLVAQAKSEGWEFGSAATKGDGGPSWKTYDLGDWLNQYFHERRSQIGVQNPIVFNTTETARSIDPDKVGVVVVDKAALDNGAVLTDFDLSRDFGLSEIRSYGDVRVTGPIRDSLLVGYGAPGLATGEKGGTPDTVEPHIVAAYEARKALHELLYRRNGIEHQDTPEWRAADEAVQAGERVTAEAERVAGGRVFRLREDQLHQANKKINDLARRAAKLGLAEPRIVPMGDEFHPVMKDGQPTGDLAKLSYIRVEGEEPKIAGWEFLATLQHLGGVNVVRRVPGNDEGISLEQYHHGDAVCDYCKTKRDRKDTFIVRNVESGLTQQIGRSCLKDFLGHGDPTAIAAYLERWRAMDDLGSLGDDDGEGGGRVKTYLPLDDYLTHVATMLRTQGWSPRSGTGFATADAARENHYNFVRKNNDQRGRPMYEVPTAEDEQRAKDALDWVRTTLAPKQNKSEFEHNMAAMTSGSHVPERGEGIVAYVPVAHAKALEKEIVLQREQTARGTSEHLGTVKERLKLRLTVEAVFEREGDYGVTYITRMADPDGNIVKWFGSYPLEQGKTYEGMWGVKKHDEYKGGKETVVTRPTKLEMVVEDTGEKGDAPVRYEGDFLERRAQRDAAAAALATGGPVHAPSEFITLPKSGKLRAPAMEALAALDSLLVIPPMHGPIPVKATAGKNTRGGYARRPDADAPRAPVWEGPTVRMTGFGKGRSNRPAKLASEIAVGDVIVLAAGYYAPVTATSQEEHEIGFGREPVMKAHITIDRGEGGKPNLQELTYKPDELIPFQWAPAAADVPEHPTLYPKEIRVSVSDDRDTDSALATLIHEMGHYIDNQAFRNYPRMAGFATDHAGFRVRGDEKERREAVERMRAAGQKGVDLLELYDAEETPLSAWLEAVRDSPEAEGLRTGVSYAEAATHKYLLSPKELWARSFAQWVATRSDNPALKAWLVSLQNQPDTHIVQHKRYDRVAHANVLVPVEEKRPNYLLLRQWSDENFVPIGEAMDVLFERLHWLRGGAGSGRDGDTDPVAGRLVGGRSGGGVGDRHALVADALAVAGLGEKGGSGLPDTVWLETSPSDLGHARMKDRVPWSYDPASGRLFIGSGGSDHTELTRAMRAQGHEMGDDEWNGVWMMDGPSVGVHVHSNLGPPDFGNPLGHDEPLPPVLASRLRQAFGGPLHGHAGGEKGDPGVASLKGDGPLPMENGLYYRLHTVGAPFGPEHASTVPPIPEEVAASSEVMRGLATPKPGYSAFWNPHHLVQYAEAMSWEPTKVRVLAFRGTPIGEGSDGEPRVMPDSTKVEARMGWQKFVDRTDWTPNGYGMWHEHTWGDGPDGRIADDGYRTLAQLGDKGDMTNPELLGGAWTLPITYDRDGLHHVVPIDATIAPDVQRAIDRGFTTVASCSGLKADHPEGAGNPHAGRSGDGYLAFPLAAHSPEQIAAIEHAAKQAGFAHLYADVYGEPGLMVYTPDMKLRQRAYRQANEAVGLAPDADPPSGAAFNEWYAARVAAFKRLGVGRATDEEVAPAWREFFDTLNGARQPVDYASIPPVLYHAARDSTASGGGDPVVHVEVAPAAAEAGALIQAGHERAGVVEITRDALAGSDLIRLPDGSIQVRGNPNFGGEKGDPSLPESTRVEPTDELLAEIEKLQASVGGRGKLGRQGDTDDLLGEVLSDMRYARRLPEYAAAYKFYERRTPDGGIAGLMVLADPPLNVPEHRLPYGMTLDNTVVLGRLVSVQPGTGTIMLRDAARYAAEHGKGLVLWSLPGAREFYRKAGMSEEKDGWVYKEWWTAEQVADHTRRLVESLDEPAVATAAGSADGDRAGGFSPVRALLETLGVPPEEEEETLVKLLLLGEGRERFMREWCGEAGVDFAVL
jgi:2'-5' RNA ligase